MKYRRPPTDTRPKGSPATAPFCRCFAKIRVRPPAIQIQRKMTRRQRRAWNVLLANASNELPQKDIHRVSLAELAAKLGFGDGNPKYLKETFNAVLFCPQKKTKLFSPKRICLDKRRATSRTFPIALEQGRDIRYVSGPVIGANESMKHLVFFTQSVKKTRGKLRMKNIFRPLTVVLIIAFVGASFLTMVPIEEAEAWNAHACNCKAEGSYDSDGKWKVTIKCDMTFHWYPFSCGFSCP